MWIVKPSSCHCTDAFGGQIYRRVPTPLGALPPSLQARALQEGPRRDRVRLSEALLRRRGDGLRREDARASPPAEWVPSLMGTSSSRGAYLSELHNFSISPNCWQEQSLGTRWARCPFGRCRAHTSQRRPAAVMNARRLLVRRASPVTSSSWAALLV